MHSAFQPGDDTVCGIMCLRVCIIPWMYSALLHVPLWKLQLCHTLCYEKDAIMIPQGEWRSLKKIKSFLLCKKWSQGCPSLNQPLGSPPPLGLRFVQKMLWLIWPPPLNFNAGCRAIWAVTSPERLKYKYIFFKVLRFMATHSSILAWRMPRTKEPGGLQSMGLQRAGSDWVTEQVVPKLHHFNILPKKKKLPQIMCPSGFSVQSIM